MVLFGGPWAQQIPVDPKQPLGVAPSHLKPPSSPAAKLPQPRGSKLAPSPGRGGAISEAAAGDEMVLFGDPWVH